MSRDDIRKARHTLAVILAAVRDGILSPAEALRMTDALRRELALPPTK